MSDNDISLPPLPPAYWHIYPLDDDCKHDVCFTPSTQGVNRTPQPVFTADQIRAFARDAVEQDRARRGERDWKAEFAEMQAECANLSSKLTVLQAQHDALRREFGVPDGCSTIAERIARIEQDPKRKAALDRARARFAAGEARPEPVARVSVHRTGGNAGIAWSAAPVYAYESLPLLADGTLLYAAPPQPAEPSDAEVDAANEALYDVLFGPSGPDVGETVLELRRRAMRAALVAAMGVKR